MTRYIVQRILAMFPVVFIVAIMVFSLVHITPGDPAMIMAGDEASPSEIDALRHELGLDRDLWRQGISFMLDTLRGDLGTSIFSQHSVRELIFSRLEPTISLAIFSEILSILIGIPLGILAAWKANTWIDRVAMIFAVMGLALPSFWLGYNLIWLFAVKWGVMPAVGYEPIFLREQLGQEGGLNLGPWLRSITMPSVTIGVIGAALITRMTRSSMLEVLREDYIRTARAKGLGEFVVLLRHGFKNAGLPVVTIIGLAIAGLVTGLVITEAVFAIPGVGRLMVNGVARRDFPVIQGIVLLTTVSYVVINLVVDLAYGYMDPRIRYR